MVLLSNSVIDLAFVVRAIPKAMVLANQGAPNLRDTPIGYRTTAIGYFIEPRRDMT